MKKLLEHKKLLKDLNIVLEALLIFLVYWVATFLRYKIPYGKSFSMFDSVIYSVLALAFTFSIIIVTYILGGYFSFHIKGVFQEFKSVLASTTVGICVCCTIIYFCKLGQFSRLLLIYFALLALVVIYTKRIFVSWLVEKYDKKYNISTNILLIGAARNSELLYKTIFEQHKLNMNLVGYIADNANVNIPNRLGGLKDIYRILTDLETSLKIDMIVIADPDTNRDRIKDIVVLATNHNIRVCCVPEFSEFMPSKNAVMCLEGNYFCELTALDVCKIMGVNISVTNMEKTVLKIKNNLSEWKGKYICVSNVHTTVTASENEEYMKIQNKAVIALPDGGPLSKFSKEQGHSGASRVTGPDLMQRILSESMQNGWKHFFYGSTQETLDKLKEVISSRYDGVDIVGMISPPFRSLTIAEDEEIVDLINKANPDFIWVGLGAPKQEVWMAAHENRVNGLMIGVGAAFDYEAGNIKRAPIWMQRANLEWLYRLLQDPKRLFTRYIKTNTKYIIWKYRNGGNNDR